MFDDDKQAITETIQQYFNGTYQGDATLLQQIFHPQAYITGNVNGEIFDWPLADFIKRVCVVPTAAEKNEKFDKSIVFIDVNGAAAMVKTKVAVGPFIFTDYIALLKMDKRWVIRSKIFST